jgi:hypothetical protein
MLEAETGSISPIPIVRIYAGGRNGFQYRAISTSISQLKRDFDCQGLGLNFNHEVKYNNDVRKLKWKPSDLVDWLLSGDMHIVCTHMHQGLPHWNVADVLEALKRLKRARITMASLWETASHVQSFYSTSLITWLHCRNS